MAKPRQLKYRSTLEDKIVPSALERGAQYEPIRLNYVGAPRYYKPDLVLPNGIVIEIKGWFTAADRAKTLAVLKTYPGLELRFVLQRSESLLDARSKTTYAAWCEAHGLRWAKGAIPASWYVEPPFAQSLAHIAAAPRMKGARRV